MVHLPAEILHQIIREIRYMDDVCLTPLATVNHHHWQLVVEDILWEYLPITAENIDCFVAFIRGKYARQRSVRHIYFKAENFKDPAETKAESDNKSGQRSDTESIDSESLGNAKSFAAFRSEHMRFTSDISTLWNQMASWVTDLGVRDIHVHVRGWSMYKHQGSGFETTTLYHTSCAKRIG